MSRTIIQLECDNPNESEKVIKKILSSYNYELKDNNGEEVYQCGIGFFTAPKFIKYSFNGNVVTLEGWVRAFAFGGESELKGFMASMPKKSCRKTLEDIQNNLNAKNVSNELQITAEEKSHTLAIVLGVIFAFLIPIIGIVFGIYLMTRNDSENAKTYGVGIMLLSVVIWGVSRMLLF
ncbi:hypothetical protein [Methanobrevibacter sp.]